MKKSIVYILISILIVCLFIGCSNNNEKKESSGEWLAAAKEIYNTVELGDSKEEIIVLLGEPDDTEEHEFEGEETIKMIYSLKDIIKGKNDTFYENYDEYFEYAVIIELKNDEVVEKSIDLYTDDVLGVYLSKELDTKVDKLNDLDDKLEEGMTLEETEEILGKAYFEDSIVNNDGEVETSYTWYDSKENYLSIWFDENSRIISILDVEESIY